MGSAPVAGREEESLSVPTILWLVEGEERRGSTLSSEGEEAGGERSEGASGRGVRPGLGQLGWTGRSEGSLAEGGQSGVSEEEDNFVLSTRLPGVNCSVLPCAEDSFAAV